MVSLDDIDSQININQVDCVNDYVETVAETVGLNVPVIGMLFESVDKMFKFYKEYGQVNGFSVKRRSLTKDVNGDYIYLIFSCKRSDKFVSCSKNSVNHHGYSKNECDKCSNRILNITSECKARLVGRVSVDGKWKITLFEDVHNHDLSPSHSRFFACNREINPCVKRQLEISDIARIRSNKSSIHLSLVPTVMIIFNFWREILETFLLGLGIYALVKDPRNTAAYHEFGDVVTFDTTYLTNKYDMPFAPFIDVNHHRHSILLGCGLISSEDTETFVWLFRTWLACMGDIAPHGIITDQVRAMKNVTEIVFPNTRHKLCLWHIMKKVPEKFGSLGEYESIKRMLAESVYNSHSIEKFESGKKKVMFTMMYDGLNIGCSCLKFEFRGILCRHAITVLLTNNEYLLPAHYIFPQWRKDVRRCHSRVKISFDGWTTTNEQVRYDHMLSSSIPNDPIIKRGKGRPCTVMKKKVFMRNYGGNMNNAVGGSRSNGGLGC
ncbi:protein FAR1-RELATED SEQUENCE 4-like [Tripterygium wilfordii]|uniref:protein FAR1-RELATED SEQUENCE 4-like n=1 Tax=Tripterygium wilfordii TaxID=458696 RepID=UPI0018F814C7|nr:protein FAR1-RELATED SEQUENCE 4-like [Tripterygium wilfordii]